MTVFQAESLNVSRAPGHQNFTPRFIFIHSSVINVVVSDCVIERTYSSVNVWDKQYDKQWLDLVSHVTGIVLRKS